MTSTPQPSRKNCVAAACFREFYANIVQATGGATLAWTVEGDGSIRRRDATTGKDLGIVWDYEGIRATKVIFSNLRLWMGYSDGRVRVLDLQPRRIVAEAAVHKEPITCLLSHRSFVYSGSDDGQVAQWDAAVAQCVQCFNVQDRVLCITALHTTEINDVLFIGTAHNAILFVDVTPRATRPSVQPYGRHTAAVTALAPFRNTLWSGSDDCCIKVWKWPDTTCAATLVQHNAPISLLTQQGPYVWSVSTDGVVVVWNAETSDCLQQITLDAGPKRAGPFVAHVAPWTIDCLWITSGDGTVRIYAAPTLEEKPSNSPLERPRNPAAMATDLAQIHQQLQDLSQRYRTVQAKERKVDERCSELEQECASWRRRCTELEARLSRSSNSSEGSASMTSSTDSEMRNQVAQLQNEIVRLKRNQDPRQKDSSEVETLRAQLAQAMAEVNNLKTALQGSHHRDDTGLGSQIQGLQNQLLESQKTIDAQAQMINELEAALESGNFNHHGDKQQQQQMFVQLAADNTALRKEMEKLKAELSRSGGPRRSEDGSLDSLGLEGERQMPDINDIYDKLLRAHEAEISANDVEQARQEAFKITRDMEGLTDQTRLLLTDLIHELAAKDFLLKMQYKDMDTLKWHCVDLYKVINSPAQVPLNSMNADAVLDDSVALEDSVLDESDTEIHTHMGNVAIDTKRMKLTIRKVIAELTKGLGRQNAKVTSKQLEQEADDRLVLCHLVFTVLRDTIRKLKDCQKRVKSSEKELEIQDAELNKGEQMVESVEKLRAEVEAMKIKAKQALEEKIRTVDLLKLQIQRLQLELARAGNPDVANEPRYEIEREVIKQQLDLLMIQGDIAECNEQLSLSELDSKLSREEKADIAARMQQLEASKTKAQGRLDQAKKDAERVGPPVQRSTGSLGTALAMPGDARAQAVIEDQKRQISKLVEELERMHTELADAKREMSRLESQRKVLGQHPVSTDELEDLREQRDVYHALAEDRLREIKKLKSELADLETRTIELQDQNKETLAHLELAEVKVNTQKSKLDRQAKEIADLQQAVHIFRRDTDDSRGGKGNAILAAELESLKEERQVLLKEREKRLELMKQNAQLEALVVRLQQQGAKNVSDPRQGW